MRELLERCQSKKKRKRENRRFDPSIESEEQVHHERYGHLSSIEATLKAAGCSYFALSPRWNDDETEIRIWLNPMKQHENNIGCKMICWPF